MVNFLDFEFFVSKLKEYIDNHFIDRIYFPHEHLYFIYVCCNYFCAKCRRKRFYVTGNCVILRSSFRPVLSVFYSVSLMFNFYTFYKFLIVAAVWSIYSSSLIQMPDLYHNFSDLSTRLWVNEFFVNTYYFYWTSFWYLTAVIVITKLTFTLVYLRTVGVTLSLIIFWLVVYSLTTFEYWGYNYTHLDFLKPEFQINSLLTNSINKYHPFIFYFTLTWVYVVNLQALTVFNNKTLFPNYQKLYLVRNLGFFLPMIYLTLGLGSWWALQEGSWGGWWNWDSSEVFGLLVMLFYLHLMHKSFTNLTRKNVKILVNLFLFLLVFVYALIQLNFDLVSHNFGTKINQFINSDQLFYIVLGTSFTFTFFVVKSYLNRLNTYVIVSKVRVLPIKVFLFTLLATITTLFSFTELVNNFFWLLLQTNVLNIINLTSYYTPLALAVLCILLTRVNVLFLSTFCYLTYNLESLYLLCVSLSSTTRVYNLHILIYLFIFVTYHYLNQSLIDWGHIVNNKHSFLNQGLVDISNTFLKLNTTYIEIPSIDLFDNQLISAGWNFIQWSTNQQVHTFQHDLFTTLTFQGLCSSLFEYLHSICVIDYSSQTLALVTFLLLAFFVSTRKNTTVILF